MANLVNSAICPQDCMPKENILMGGFHMQNELGLGFGKVKRPDMICTCQGQSCSCIHQNISHSVVEEDETKKGKISSSLMLHLESNFGYCNWPLSAFSYLTFFVSAPICDFHCKWIGSVVTLLTSILAVVLFLFRRRWESPEHEWMAFSWTALWIWSPIFERCTKRFSIQ